MTKSTLGASASGPPGIAQGIVIALLAAFGTGNALGVPARHFPQP